MAPVRTKVNDAFVDLSGLAAQLGLSVRTIRTLVHDLRDPLPAYRVGGKLLLRRSEVDAWMARRRVRPGELAALTESVLLSLSGSDPADQADSSLHHTKEGA